MLAGALVLSAPLCGCGAPASGSLEWETGSVPADATVHARLQRDVDALLAEIRRKVDSAEADLDPRVERGDLARLNRGAAEGFHEGTPIDLYACLNLALSYARLGDGAYDPTIGALTRLRDSRRGTAEPPRPAEIEVALARVGWEKVTLSPETRAVAFRVPGMTLDLGPVREGCALDWAARVFARAGSVGGRIRVGGVQRAWRHPPGEPAWSLELADPRAASRELLTIRVADRGVAVCGQADPIAGAVPGNPAPLLDPRTGRMAASDVLAAVAAADSAADAAALCQTLYVAGSLRGSAVLSRMRRVEVFLLLRSDAAPPFAVASASLSGRIVLSPELERETGGDVRYLLP